MWGIRKEWLSDDQNVDLVVALRKWSQSGNIALWTMSVKGGK